MSPAFDTTDRLTRNRKRPKKEDSQRKFIAEYVYFALKSGKNATDGGYYRRQEEVVDYYGCG